MRHYCLHTIRHDVLIEHITDHKTVCCVTLLFTYLLTQIILTCMSPTKLLRNPIYDIFFSFMLQSTTCIFIRIITKAQDWNNSAAKMLRDSFLSCCSSSSPIQADHQKHPSSSITTEIINVVNKSQTTSSSALTSSSSSLSASALSASWCRRHRRTSSDAV